MQKHSNSAPTPTRAPGPEPTPTQAPSLEPAPTLTAAIPSPAPTTNLSSTKNHQFSTDTNFILHFRINTYFGHYSQLPTQLQLLQLRKHRTGQQKNWSRPSRLFPFCRSPVAGPIGGSLSFSHPAHLSSTQVNSQRDGVCSKCQYHDFLLSCPSNPFRRAH
jgi:hypothetical protein